MLKSLKSGSLEDRARKIVDALGGTWSRKGGMCCCPAHADRTPSLSVTIGRRAILFHCFAGCSNEAVLRGIAKAGIKAADLFDGSGGAIVAQPREDTPSRNALRLWREASVLAGSHAADYLASRAIAASSPDLRFHPCMPLGPRDRVRFNAAIERGFVKQGTSISTRLLVLDKVEARGEPVLAISSSFPELAAMIDALAARIGDEPVPLPANLPVRSPLKLVPAAHRPLPTPAKPANTPLVVEPLTYASLETAAPLAEQVGHYLPYRPSRVVIEQAAEHPTPLVESVAMGSIAAPIPTAIPQLPGGLVAKGVLSAAQAETLIYAASAHARDLPGCFKPDDRGCALKASAEGRSYRQGYFLGDGTGAGKGRQVAGVILDRWVRGERRHIWISKNEALLEDARRDWSALGGLPIDIQPLGSWKLGTAIAMREGILFVTYPTLRSGRSDATQLDQILAWAGDDFDGVIVFDEAHAMANAAGGEGSRGKVKGSEQGIAGVRLQNLLPRARVLYASATGASDVNNLAYATRLGLWGPETAFANREAFVAEIRDGGIAAMELVARDLKSLGLYTARALSFAGVEYEILEHCLTPDQIAVYDAYAQGWQVLCAAAHKIVYREEAVMRRNAA